MVLLAWNRKGQLLTAVSHTMGVEGQAVEVRLPTRERI